MIDVKFEGAMRPLIHALTRAYVLSEDSPTTQAAAAVVEALGIPAQMVASPTFRYALAFAVEMEKRLGLPENRTKGGRENWMTSTPLSLVDAAWRHLDALRLEVETALESDGVHDTEEVLRRAVNAANFLLMVADRTGALKVPANSAQLPPIRPDEPEAVTTPNG